MGYSKNRDVLEQIKEDLLKLKEGQACVFSTGTGQGDRLAYKIREAIYVARMFPEEYAEIANRSSSFKVSLLNDHEVRVTRLTKMTIESRPAATVEMGDNVSPPAVEQVAGMQTAESIMQRWSLSAGEMIYFPEANLSREHLMDLWDWCQENSLMFFVSDNGGLTMQTVRSDLVEFSWHPDDLNSEVQPPKG